MATLWGFSDTFVNLLIVRLVFVPVFISSVDLIFSVRFQVQLLPPFPFCLLSHCDNWVIGRFDSWRVYFLQPLEKELRPVYQRYLIA